MSALERVTTMRYTNRRLSPGLCKQWGVINNGGQIMCGHRDACGGMSAVMWQCTAVCLSVRTAGALLISSLVVCLCLCVSVCRCKKDIASSVYAIAI